MKKASEPTAQNSLPADADTADTPADAPAANGQSLPAPLKDAAEQHALESKTTAEAIEQLHCEHADGLQRIAWSILRDWSLAADAVQESFVLLTGQISEIEAAHRVGWLVKTVQFHAHNLRRKRSRAERLPIELWTRGLSCEVEEADSRQQSERHEQLWQAVDGLPEKQQVVIRMRLRDERTFAEIAKELDVPLGTVLSRMRLALEKLRARMDTNRPD